MLNKHDATKKLRSLVERRSTDVHDNPTHKTFQFRTRVLNCATVCYLKDGTSHLSLVDRVRVGWP